ncbi:MAG: DUF167 domain-containing protein [Candidatus Omnitrophota bacterium]
MIIQVKVIPGAKKNMVHEVEGGIRVQLTAPPVDGKANEALVDLLAEYYGVRSSRIEIIKGLKSRHKVINIKNY